MLIKRWVFRKISYR